MNDRLGCKSLTERINIWALPLNANAGKITGAPYRISESVAAQIYPMLSPDGRRLLFSSNRNGIFQLWQRDLITGKEALIDPRESSTWGWFLQASGRIAYRERSGFILDPATGESRKFTPVDISGVSTTLKPSRWFVPLPGWPVWMEWI
jgi:hypothetical protein